MDSLKHTKICILSLSVAMIALTGAFILCGILPPQDPSRSAQDIANWYSDHHTRIQIGAIIGGIGAVFYAPFAAAIAYEVKRLTGNTEAAYLQVILGVITTWGFVGPWTTFMAASFRQERPAEVTHALYDSAWFPLYTVSAAFGLQFVFLCWAMLADRQLVPTYPRWFAYFTAFTGISQMFGMFVVLTKDGPFAWNGLIAFWFPFVIFGIWTNILLKYLSARLKEPSGAEAELRDGDARLDGAAAGA